MKLLLPYPHTRFNPLAWLLIQTAVALRCARRY